jgi:hypothetical protein
MSPTHLLSRTEAKTAAALGVPVEIIGGLPIAVIGRAQSARLMLDLATARRNSGRRALVFTSANGQVLSMCAQDARMRDLFLGADLIHADGMPLVFASRFFCESPLPERIATTDLFHDAAAIAPEYGARFYMLGATKAIIEQAARRARALYPNVEIVGHRSGYFSSDEESQVIETINAGGRTSSGSAWGPRPSSYSRCAIATGCAESVSSRLRAGYSISCPEEILVRRIGCRQRASNGLIGSFSNRDGLPAVIS